MRRHEKQNNGPSVHFLPWKSAEREAVEQNGMAGVRDSFIYEVGHRQDANWQLDLLNKHVTKIWKLCQTYKK
jgi:hypothetical protein